MFTEHNIWVLLIISVVIAAMIVAWWAVSDAFSVSGIGSIGEDEPAEEVRPVLASATQTDEINALKDTLRDLNETARMLMDSITYLETKLIRAHVLSDDLIENEENLAIARVEPRTAQPASQPGTVSPAAPAAGMAAEKPSESTGEHEEAAVQTGKTARQPPEDAERQKPVNVASSTTPETMEKPQSAGTAHEQGNTPEARTAPPEPTQSPPERAAATAVTRPTTEQTGEWVINLASLRSLKQAENFRSNAGMKGFDTSIQPVTVKGRDYWRVQITGLATREDANARGEAIKQRLGLKDIWISLQR